MSGSLMRDAFGHHVWATQRLIDACLALDPEQLASAVPGTYGSILDTLRHLVGSDVHYLYALSGGRRPLIDEDRQGLAGLRTAMAADGDAWSSVLAEALDPDTENVRRRDDGSETRTTVGIRLAQALHHGSDHRSQVCTALTALGIEPPAIDVWDYGAHVGRVVEVPATS